MSELNASNLRKEQGNEGPDLVGLTEITSPYFMVPPSGTTEQRPHNPEPGTLRFNTDSGGLEYFRGDGLGWEFIEKVNPNLGGGTGSNTGSGTRALFGGGFDVGSQPASDNTVNYLTIPTLGNAQDFGDLATGVRQSGQGQMSSRTRGMVMGGSTASGLINTIQYATMASTGNFSDFGDCVSANKERLGFSNQVRCMQAAGELPSTNQDIEYITIASNGQNASDFGANMGRECTKGVGIASPTRGLFIGGKLSSTTYNTIDYVTIMTTGDAIDFGDLTVARTQGAAIGNATRAVVAGGIKASQDVTYNTIDYVTIATTGNATDFGDMTTAMGAVGGMASSPTRGVWGGGYAVPTPTATNAMEYITLSTLGNSADFGDLTVAMYYYGISCSSGHGGL